MKLKYKVRNFSFLNCDFDLKDSSFMKIICSDHSDIYTCTEYLHVTPLQEEFVTRRTYTSWLSQVE